MEEIDNILAYENSLKIIQEKDAFSFSIDSTILSFFAEANKRQTRILDIGTGTGSIPLFMSLFTKMPIKGIEIDKNQADRAERSVKLNNLENQIEIINDDIKNYKILFNQSSFSMILTNPPYFKIDETKLKNKNEDVTVARHEKAITMEEIIMASTYLLTDGGSFNMVQRTERFLETIELLKKYRLTPKRIRFVYPKVNKDSYVFLIDARKNGKDHGLKILEPLYIYDESGDYSKEILEYFHYGENDEKK